ncbi:MAG: hypothetical protein WAO71_05735 [Gallionella sp.]
MRHDHTNWLIHFVRDRVPEQDFPGESEDEANFFAGGELEYDARAFSVLKTIVSLGGLIPGHSFRSGRTTIYGGQPVVCVTEMPLYSFAMYVKNKANSEKVSAYGIAFLKSEFFAAGGRHAVYGLSAENISYVHNDNYCRIIDPIFLPIEEQYRYVAYSPSGSHWIDWSHEREWRWKVNNSDLDYVWCRDGNGCDGPVGGLPLFRGANDGGFFSRLCIIVWNQKEAIQIQELLTGFFLAGHNNYDTAFSRSVISNSRIIILENVIAAVEQGHDLDAQTIEGLEDVNLVSPIILHPSPVNAPEIIAQAFQLASIAGEKAANAYLQKHPVDSGLCGYADAVTYEVTNPLVQYMINNGFASTPFDGMVHIHVRRNWPSQQSIDYNECIYQAVVDILTKSLGVKVMMRGRLD